MDEELKVLMGLRDLHAKRGEELFEACGNEIFPCDFLTIAILDRSINLMDGFSLLLSSGGYTTSIGLLRMQLDSVLRFNAIVKMCDDPHGVADKISAGEKITNIENRHGKKMFDSNLVKELSAHNGWVEGVYELACGYVHFSGEHIFHVFEKSKQNKGGERVFIIGTGDDYIDKKHKIDLVKCFTVVTKGILDLVEFWVLNRYKYGTYASLKTRFNHQ